MQRIHFETLGCKLNQIETESLAHAFREAGFLVDNDPVYRPVGIESATTPTDADSVIAVNPVYRPVGIEPSLYILNTCTVTGKAEQKARRIIRLMLRANPEATVLVTGCYAEVETAAISAIDPRIVVFPGSRKGALADLPSYLARKLEQDPLMPLGDAIRDFSLMKIGQSDEPGTQARSAQATSSDAIKPSISETFRLSTDDFLFHSRASIKIQDGCSNRCSYCRIRLARGKAVSLDSGEVIARVQKIEDAGWGEVTLSGVNLSQYRSRDGDFADLLARLLAETSRIAIRVSSLYPERVDDAILPMLAHDRILPHFHLSVQSGSDRILAAMRRPYKAEAVLRAVERLRSIKENPFIACDIIAGFPGETDDDFAETLSLCAKANFAWIHAFPFSPRPGTEAWDMRPRVPERVAGERVAILTELAEKNHRAYADYWVGRVIPAIAEQGAEGAAITAVTDNYLSVTLSAVAGSIPRGKRIKVRLTAHHTAKLES
jgi:threonylcarbamoyladenosine tRNA methylthiotransferase MtaB